MIPKVRRPQQRRMLALEVRDNVRISPSFARITLGGPALDGFEHTGRDQAGRLFFPREGQDELRMPTLQNDGWIAELLIMPKSRRPWVRTYTIRDYRAAEQEVDIEFALHGDAGPASAWASRAKPGDPAGFFDEGYTYLPPGPGGRQVLVGDESALPAILSILEGAPESLEAEVFLEVPDSGDIREVECAPGVHLHWFARNGAATVPGELALDGVRKAELPQGAFYTWAAGEAKLATGVRRHLVADRGIPKSDIAFMGYWRHGRSSPG
ncbi:siderophore-interacting protein [Winogradskya humida]|uniref:Siderophore-interacting protein n=1 Tax=Winogradskya humida TaxID=113566 RepID=A0ABQ3ZJY5_9ACTN|nr:siderophore-interacting protein [Actinoplanes humidus]GIE18905.1 siderophore-interacting protein [Actinoplanes humidus]